MLALELTRYEARAVQMRNVSGVVLLLSTMLCLPAVALERMPERVAPCAACHGEQGRSQVESYYPSIAGKPAGYLFNQLRHFRDGRREHRVMAEMLANLSDDYLRQMADYYAGQTPRVAPSTQSQSMADLSAARQLVEQGDAAAELPACSACHGQSLHGRLPDVPGLTGLDAEYIAAQLGAWRAGVRRAAEPDCMGEIARRLTPAQINQMAEWLAALPASAQDAPEPPSDEPLPMRCFAPEVGHAGPPAAPRNEEYKRGEYLVRAGNCVGCHSARGGQPLSGGRAIETPFGAIYSSNLTPDVQTGLGAWSADDFWVALKQGKSADGRLLYPAFPYTHYSLITRQDSDAMWVYLKAQPAVVRAQRENTLRFPFNTQLALWVWRWMFFERQTFEPDPEQDAQWNRGRYLVEGLGHCSACHGGRNVMGAVQPARAFAGSLLPDRAWYAPPLAKPRNSIDDEAMFAVLKHGSAAHQVASGPMAEVVADSLQYLTDQDIKAMMAYLDSRPPVEPTRVSSLAVSASLKAAQMVHGEALYQQHCADCHGIQGQGEAFVFPALKHNDAVIAASPGNAIRSLKFGGYPPSTQGHPFPFGMPPFAQQLDANDMAAVLTYVRNAWGHEASAVSPVEVSR